MAQNAASEVIIMEYLSALAYGCSYGFGIAFLVSLFWFLIRVAIFFFPEIFLFKFIRSRIIKRQAIKIERLGFKTYLYVTWLDRFKLSVGDMDRKDEQAQKNPIIFEQHALRDFPFRAGLSCLAYRKNSQQIVGKLYRLNSNSDEIKSIVVQDKG